MINMPIVIELPGAPVPKGRPRMTRHGRAYTPAKTRRYEQSLAQAGQAAMSGKQPIDGPIQVSVVAFFEPPTSWPRWKKMLVDKSQSGVQHTVKPDADNLAKTIDGLNGIVWVDDAQITELIVRKRYSTWPRLTVTVRHDPDRVHSKSRMSADVCG